MCVLVLVGVVRLMGCQAELLRVQLWKAGGPAPHRTASCCSLLLLLHRCTVPLLYRRRGHHAALQGGGADPGARPHPPGRHRQSQVDLPSEAVCHQPGAAGAGARPNRPGDFQPHSRCERTVGWLVGKAAPACLATNASTRLALPLLPPPMLPHLPAPPPCPPAPLAGKAKYDPKRSALVWKIKKFAGEQEHTLAASVELIATTREKRPWSRPPLSLSFQVRVRVCGAAEAGIGGRLWGGRQACRCAPPKHSDVQHSLPCLPRRPWRCAALPRRAHPPPPPRLPLCPRRRCRCTARAASRCSTSRSGRSRATRWTSGCASSARAATTRYASEEEA